LERMILFSEGSSFFDQIVSKLKLVYSHYDESKLGSNVDQRVVLVIPEAKKIETEALKINEYEVDGDEEYEIVLDAVKVPTSDNMRRSHHESYQEEGSESSSETDSITTVEKVTTVEDVMSSHQIANLHHQDLASGQYLLYFDRAPLTELRGNLIVSVILQVPRKRFYITVFDPISKKETFIYLSFTDALPFLSRFSKPQELEDELSNLDEGVALDLLDEIFHCIEIIDDEDSAQESVEKSASESYAGRYCIVLRVEDEDVQLEHSRVQFMNMNRSPFANNSGTGGDEDENRFMNSLAGHVTKQNIVICKIRGLIEGHRHASFAKKREAQKAYRLSLEVIAAKELDKPGMFGTR
jgi:hypothetical protein